MLLYVELVEGPVSVPASTITVPCIQAWKEQWYVYVPGVVKVNWKVPPCVVRGPVLPESKIPAVSDVTVCGAVSSFVQNTVLFLPMNTVTTSGENP